MRKLYTDNSLETPFEVSYNDVQTQACANDEDTITIGVEEFVRITDENGHNVSDGEGNQLLLKEGIIYKLVSGVPESTNVQVIDVVIPERYTFTINPTPNDATVTLTATGEVQAGNSITVDDGTTVSYSVEASGYVSQSGTYTVNGADHEETVVLVEEPSVNTVLTYVGANGGYTTTDTYNSNGNLGIGKITYECSFAKPSSDLYMGGYEFHAEFYQLTDAIACGGSATNYTNEIQLKANFNTVKIGEIPCDTPDPNDPAATYGKILAYISYVKVDTEGNYQVNLTSMEGNSYDSIITGQSQDLANDVINMPTHYPDSTEYNVADGVNCFYYENSNGVAGTPLVVTIEPLNNTLAIAQNSVNSLEFYVDNNNYLYKDAAKTQHLQVVNNNTFYNVYVDMNDSTQLDFISYKVKANNQQVKVIYDGDIDSDTGTRVAWNLYVRQDEFGIDSSDGKLTADYNGNTDLNATVDNLFHSV